MIPILFIGREIIQVGHMMAIWASTQPLGLPLLVETYLFMFIQRTPSLTPSPPPLLVTLKQDTLGMMQNKLLIQSKVL